MSKNYTNIKNRHVGVKKRCRIFTAGNGKHRAAIVIPNKETDAMLITQISNEDAVCLEIIHEKLKFFAVRMYLDIEEQIEISFTKIDEILQFAKGARILIATDSNDMTKLQIHAVKTGVIRCKQTSPYSK